jgi:predicted ATP-binding protein involved in virulence
MKIENLRLQSFRCFKDLELEFAKHVTLLVAPNGGGKTALLDGIAAALGGLGESLGVAMAARLGHRDVRRTYQTHEQSVLSAAHYPARVDVSIVFDDGTKASSFRGLDEGKEWLLRPPMDSPARQWFNARIEDDRAQKATIFPCMAYYRVGRTRIENGASKAEEEQRADPYPDPSRTLALAGQGTDKSTIPERRQGWHNAMNATAEWRAAHLWWSFEYLAAAAEGRPVSALCRVVEGAVSQALAEPEAKRTPRWSANDRDIVVWVQHQGPRPVGMLSDGYRSTVALFADLARRCALLNPHLGSEAARQTPGVVLIDEPDLYLHPSWQRRILSDLREAFPLMQFVLTTHSPQVISGASHVLSKDGDRLLFLESTEGEQPEPISLREPVGLLADQVLTGPWFRLSSSLDTEALALIEEHRKLVQKKKLTKRERGRKDEIEAFLRRHLGRFYETHRDEVVHRVVSAILADRPDATWEDIEEAGDRALKLLRKRL